MTRNMVKVGEVLLSCDGVPYGAMAEDFINTLLRNGYALEIEHIHGDAHIIIYAREEKELCMDF